MSEVEVRWVLSPGWGMVDRPGDGEHGGTLYLAPMTSGEIHVVTAATAVVCRAVLASRGIDEVRERTATALGVPVDQVDRDVLTEVLDDLQQLGALRSTSLPPARRRPPAV
ncbi:hypothetical protein ACQE98_08205 [Ornithinimicrobium sp. W1679]|uniref:hypothetical protein n=1 Tax=Ornithinimicrobium sp. W1679 TaxID=3418770 RepID=UPI003CE8E416